MKNRVKIPDKSPAQALELVNKIQSKHVTDGDDSPLKILNWGVITPDVESFTNSHKEAERLKREHKSAFQQRELKLKPVVKFIRDSRDVLTGIYSGEMKKLGEWGFEVFEPRSKKKKEDDESEPEDDQPKV